MADYNLGVSKEGLILRVAGTGLFFLTSCLSDSPSTVVTTVSPTPESAPRQSPLDQPQTVLDRLRKESTLQYAKLYRDRIDFKGGSGKTYTLAGPPYLDQAIILMERRNSVCGFAGDEESRAYEQLREDFRKFENVARRSIDKAMSKKINSCSPFMKKH